MTIKIPKSRGDKRTQELINFADKLMEVQRKIGFKISGRGWCYQLEGFGLIDKGQFDKIQKLINDCRKEAFLPLDFVAEDESRGFSCVEEPTMETPDEHLLGWLRAVRNCANNYDLSFWEGQEYYIQMLVEKVDLKTLFMPICRKYHIPISNSKGWSSILQRAKFIERFKEAEDKGMTPVLLYCGDFDPAGLQISELLTKNIDDLSKATEWETTNLVVDRFGLNHDFILDHGLTWVDNLKTGSGKDLANPAHTDHYKPYVQGYIKKYGIKKVEANAIVIVPDKAKQLCTNTITKYLRKTALEQFEKKEIEKQQEIEQRMTELELDSAIDNLIEEIEESE